MNFFGHAWLAALRRDDAGFVLGAMLPDLAPMAGLVVAAIDDPDVAAGLAFHLTCDSAFHRAPAFNSLVVSASLAMQDSGIRRGPARGSAHVGVELFLDGWIARIRGVPEAYRAALAAAPQLAPRIHFEDEGRAAPGALSLEALCGKIAASELPEAYGDPRFTAERIARVLSRRPRLALTEPERALMEHWAIGFSAGFGTRAGALLDEVAAAVRAATNEPDTAGMIPR